MYSIVTAKSIYKQKLPQLGRTTGRNSYWLVNVTRFLVADSRPVYGIVSYARSCDWKNDLLQICWNMNSLLRVLTSTPRVHGRVYRPYTRPCVDDLARAVSRLSLKLSLLLLFKYLNLNIIIGSRPSDHYFRSVCWFVCLFVCAEFFSAVLDPISIKLGHMLYVCV